jgi:phosphate transport system substrate-binding protein
MRTFASRRSLVAAAAATLVAGSVLAARQVAVDPQLPVYEPTRGVAGSIKSVGSDTMNNLMTRWGEVFREYYPNVQIEVEGKGSSTAPPALIRGTASFGPMSRRMKPSEIDAFEARFGYKPTLLRTGIDMLAVFVHKDNPIAERGLTLEEVDAIFSKTRKGGHEAIETWGDLGLTGEWANKPISLYGRNSASGTYGYFKSEALFEGDFRDSVKEQPGSSAVIQGVASDRFAIGYSGVGYATVDVKAVPLSKRAMPRSAAVPPDAETVQDYPLARFLYVYVNARPNAELDPVRREFVRFIFSQRGQEAVIQQGYIPVRAPIAARDLRAVGLSLTG